MAFTISDLNYEKDSKERMPWEHYMEEYKNADPAEIASRLEIPYDREKKAFTLTMLGTQYQITYPDFQVSHTPDQKGFYPLETMIYAKILTIRFLLHGMKCPGEKYISVSLTDAVSSVWHLPTVCVCRTLAGSWNT